LLCRNYKLAAFSHYWNYMDEQDSIAVTYYPHGASFADSSSQIVTPQPTEVLTLTDFTITAASGGIAGTIYDQGTGRPQAAGTYYVLALDEQGFIAKGSGYSTSFRQITGDYLLKGLRPGNYFLLALCAPLNDHEYKFATWHGGITADIDSILVATKFNPPVGADMVTVGEGMTSGIDFRFSITGAQPGTGGSVMPATYSLEQNYPNPFNPVTRIRYHLPSQALVKLAVYDILGRQVSVLVHEQKHAGQYEVLFDASRLASGVYFYRLSAGGYVETKKLMLLH
jgi:hypothetical protein